MSLSVDVFSQAEVVIDQFYLALSNKDLVAARACCSPAVRFWHSFDGVVQDLDQAALGWQGLFAHFPENRVIDVRREALVDGLVQRHLFLLRDKEGSLKGKACCIFVKVQNGLLTRLDEYIDLSRDLTLADDARYTLGLPEVGMI